MKKNVIYQIISYILIGILIFLDQYTKHWAVVRLKGNSPIIVIDKILEFSYLENRGAAFGSMQGKQTFFIILTLILSVFLFYILFKVPKTKYYLPLIFTDIVLISGALGNFIDRVSQNYVVDFISAVFIDFPIFNVADIYVVCSMILAVILLTFYYKDEDLSFLSLKRKKNDKKI
ncbi:MAG: signal peptidase II [Lachnospiraceae bacterium]|nr:signal peptidase II [Lachnospiraceae bacterium]